MPKLHVFRVFLNKCLTAAATEIFGAFEKTVVDYREENDQLRRMLEIKAKTEPSKKDSLQVSVSEEEVPPKQKHSGSSSLQQGDPEPRQIKEEQEELRTSQEEEPLQGLFYTKDSILTPLCVKSECDQGDPLSRETPAEYPPVSGLKMSELQSFHVFLNERLMVSAAVEIFREVERTVSEYQEENDHLRRLIQLTPEIQSSAIDSLKVSGLIEEVSQEWGGENPEPTQIKEEQEEAQLQRFFGTDGGILTPPCVKTLQVEIRESDSNLMVLRPLQSGFHLRSLDMPCEPPDNKNEVSSHSSALIRDPVGLESSLPLDQNPPMGEPLPKLSTTSRTHRCHDCGETFSLKDDLQSHVTLTRRRSSEYTYCNKCHSSSNKLKAPGRFAHHEKHCPICGMTFKYQVGLARHMKIHTDEKPFSCGDCGKRFSMEQYLKKHKHTHTGEKPFSCVDCGQRFSNKAHLRRHKLMHSGEKLFSCDDCGKKFRHEENFKNHKLAHTGEKPFSCSYCGKSFIIQVYLRKHILTHTGEKPFSCGDCGKKFRYEVYLERHTLTHTGEKPFSCVECGKGFSQKGGLNRHLLIHIGEKPFSCGYCGRKFMRVGDLRKHKQIHRREKSVI